MDDSNDLLNSGDENKTILLDESIDKPNESSNESEQDVNKQSSGSLRAVDISELIDNKTDGDDFMIDEIKNLEEVTVVKKLDDKNVKNSDDDTVDQLEIVRINRNPDELSEDDVEETVVERLIGLTEMFPDSFRNVGYSVLSNTFPFIKRTYNLTRNISWIFFSSFAILVVAVSLEKDRCQTQRDIDRQMLLGGGKSAGLGMAPAPISK